jgi:hypothetical protein
VYGNPIPLSYFPETPQLSRVPTELPCKANVENLPGFIDVEDGDDCLNVDHGSTCDITRPNMRCVEHFCNNGNFFPKQVTCISLHVDDIVTENSNLQNANRTLKEESQKELKRLEDENIDSLRGIADLKEAIELEKERLKRAVVEKEAIEEEKVRLQDEKDKMFDANYKLNDAKEEAERKRNLLQAENHDLIRERNNLRSEKQALFYEKTNVEKEREKFKNDYERAQDSFHETQAKLDRQHMMVNILFLSASFLFLMLLGTCLFFRTRSKVKLDPPLHTEIPTIKNGEGIKNDDAIHVQSPSLSLTELDIPSMLKETSLRKRRSRINEW